MLENYESLHKEHFASNWLAWAALHHFLPAPLLRKLSCVIVDCLSNGALRFDQLFDELVPEGSLGFESWQIRPLSAPSQLAEYLQYRIRAFAWQSDEGGFLSLVRDDSPGAISPSHLERSIEFGAADFSSNNIFGELEEDVTQSSMKYFILSFMQIRSFCNEGCDSKFIDEIEKLLKPVEMPLAAVMLKHLGDLCADIDEWDKARIIYHHVIQQLLVFNDPTWSDYVSSLLSIATQSHATSLRYIHGANVSAEILNAALTSTTAGSAPILHGNATFDAYVAIHQANPASMVPDSRATVLLPPLLLKTHNASAAIGSWLNGKFTDANTRFWALLRRQIALGAATESRTTKAWYARSLFEEVEQAGVGKSVQRSFKMATQLLIESGNRKAVSSVRWTEQIVCAYVDQSCVDVAIRHTENYSGAKLERQQVLVELFREWIEKIPVERTELTTSMLKHISSLALVPVSFDSDQNIGGYSLEALLSISKKRPELRQLIINEIIDVITMHLQPAGFWRGSDDALKLAFEYLDILDDKKLRHVIDSTLSLLDKTDPETGLWPIVRPAMQLLVSKSVNKFVKRHSDLGQLILNIILKFGLMQQSENINILFYLHNFDSTLLDSTSIREALQDVVRKIRIDACKINSSNVVDNIRALLLAPSVSGVDGIEDALKGLMLILSSARSARPSIALSYAYDSLLLLINNKQKIAQALEMNYVQLKDKLKPIIPLIVELWQEAKKRPLVFAPFSLPPTTKPDQIIIHNWAFASIHFAEMLQESRKIEEALSEAATQPMLANGIALARATQSVAEKNDTYDADAIRLENRETFYSVLGRRLVVLQRLDDNFGAELCRSLLEQCFKYGPCEIDAAVFLLAVRFNPNDKISQESYSNYIKRLENKRDLRLTLMPILHLVKNGGEADAEA